MALERNQEQIHLQNVCDCEEEMQMLNKEMEHRKALYETRFRALSEQSGDSRKAAAELENDIQALQAGEGRRGSRASQSNGCCFDPARWEQVFACGANWKEIGMKRRRQTSGMKALRCILLWILIGVRMQMVEVAETEIQARRDMERSPRGKHGEMEEDGLV